MRPTTETVREIDAKYRPGPGPVTDPRRSPAGSARLEPSARGDGPRGPLAGLRVLVADDDRIPRRVAAAAVRRAGGEPIEVEDGTAAVAVWATATFGAAFDAVVLDFVMPGFDGADVVRTLRALGFDGPAIGVTAAATDAQAAAWVEAGCDEVLPKSAPAAELVTELAAAFRRRRNARRLPRRPR